MIKFGLVRSAWKVTYLMSSAIICERLHGASRQRWRKCYNYSAVGNVTSPVLSTCTCLARPGVCPIVIAEVTTRRRRDGPEEKNAPGGSHEKAAKCSRRHSLDAPSRERREHVVTRGGLWSGRKGSEGGRSLSRNPGFSRGQKKVQLKRVASVTGILSNS